MASHVKPLSTSTYCSHTRYRRYFRHKKFQIHIGNIPRIERLMEINDKSNKSMHLRKRERFAMVDKNGLTILSTDTDLGAATPLQESDFSTSDYSDMEWEASKKDHTEKADNSSFLEYKLPSSVGIKAKAGIKTNQDLDLDSDYYDSWCLKYINFTDENPTTYHAISTLSDSLKSAGFEYRSERDHLEIAETGGAYFVSRGGKALCAFLVGAKWKPERGIGAVGSHVDALTAKLKPLSIKSDVKGYSLLGVAPYSGALNLLWLDRDLGIAGSILVRDPDGNVRSKLVSSGRHAICRIPSLAPHFGPSSKPPYNTETQMVPVMAYGTDEGPATEEEKSSPLYNKHSLSLLRYISNISGTKLLDILQLDLDLYDVQPACRGGLKSDFMFAPRIDDRLCSFSALHALIQVKDRIDFRTWDGFTAVLLADNEEIGSATRTGAKGKLLNSVVERVVLQQGFDPASVPLVFANSILLSADVTHALNPNFVSDYLEGHAPFPNTGLVIKLDANGHVMTDLTGLVLMDKIAKGKGLTLQKFHIRNDHPSGGTIGPMLAVDTGSRVIDVGLAQLSMHSIRASCGYKEVGIGVESFAAFFENWRSELDTMDYE